MPSGRQAFFHPSKWEKYLMPTLQIYKNAWHLPCIFPPFKIGKMANTCQAFFHLSKSKKRQAPTRHFFMVQNQENA